MNGECQKQKAGCTHGGSRGCSWLTFFFRKTVPLGRQSFMLGVNKDCSLRFQRPQRSMTPAVKIFIPGTNTLPGILLMTAIK
jgi:hypothetical protein